MNKIPYDEKHQDSIYHRYIITEPVSLSKAISEIVGEGNNKLIRNGGVRITNKDNKLLKHWKQERNPDFMINEKTYIALNRGRSVVVIETKGEG
ncbi:MAG: hypothetical protein DRJ03_20740 [Chloroflexi bacterium]|nr:MAG: hypothetical protein DRJ03_20740 [Chloroflexota bacterium]